MDVMSSTLQQQRMNVEQLRREAAIERQTISESCAKMMKYITEHEQEDHLLTGFSSQKVNPFREKSSCIVL
ncbi:guanine nucleotide-binding protein subunit gamma-1 [Episyrphus balteatus]|uniref:guanine nucleotide-binding protein subunit gamma-1 n=1 Tax=Episyrphus balteatus TaxID=286459 RepID=UPI0024866A5C|nr:guanine nucleotide-binding protein subunit gamma-1 [Episyrphus balteatus]XP_055855662.1 guanine nucleotide-binding protein subunit gamma-1 [Episyrphus balteatus]XP_055855663.1 guanine nucleotide-binding protein subunit gamma-1 [Episyrphus balteatus]XP_055902194.1 guanine nucleotide-binding protein subunit gamma-1 [Eupeodes corollae]XP_055902195.1 guanine nucleotide-binding protein subunit gamma-1 [Eupeodes corollae]XP_055902196.1 guanine nucleotide-binding protein subunit gamma-1 [Eupeodes 